MTDAHHVVSQFGGNCRSAYSKAPKVHEDFGRKLEALLGGGEAQRKRGLDPKLACQLSNASETELAELVR